MMRKTELQKAREEVQTLKERITNLVSELNESEQERSALAVANGGLENRVTDLVDELSEVRDELSESKTACQRITCESDSYKDRLDRATRNIATLTRALAEVSANV